MEKQFILIATYMQSSLQSAGIQTWAAYQYILDLTLKVLFIRYNTAEKYKIPGLKSWI